MKSKVLTLVAVCLIAIAIATLPAAAEEMAAAASDPSGNITDTERAELVGLLEESRSELEALAAQATADDWSWRPAEERWSVGEVVEHLVLAEEGFHGLVAGALESGMSPEWEATLEGPDASGIVGMMKDRSQKFQAPAQFVPTGEQSRDDLLARFAALRAKSLDFVRSTHEPIKQYIATGPPGTMNVHQWMAFAGAHNLRHNLQIKEVFQVLHHGDDDSDSESDSDSDSDSDPDSDSGSESDSHDSDSESDSDSDSEDGS